MFAIPTLKDLVERARLSFRAYLRGSDAWLWPNNIYATAKVIGGATSEVFAFADYISEQKFALTADFENLVRHGAELGLTPRPAAAALGSIDIAVTDGGGITVLNGALFRRLDGIEYVASSGATLSGSGTLTVPATATTDGKATLADTATPLEIVSGVTVTDPAVTAAVSDGGMTQGTDLEDPETFRARILFRKRNPPHGGSAADYVGWAGNVAGVSFDLDRPTVFVERLWNGPGTVRVFPLMYDLFANGIPDTAGVTRVSDYLETVRPSGARVTVAAAEAVPINITITGLSPDITSVREAVLAELRAAFRRLSRVAGADTPHGGMPYLATPTSFSRSWIWQSVANASGEERHVITTPAADTALTAGQMATLGTVTFA